MPLTAPFAQLAAVRSGFASLASRNGSSRQALLRSVSLQVKNALREQFRDSVGPSGSPWQQTTKGKPSLVSKKLPGAFRFEVANGVLKGKGKSNRDMLEAHQLGHSFGSRRAGGSTMSFSARGRLISAARFRRASELARARNISNGLMGKKLRKWKGFERRAIQHTVGARVLPARPIVPTGSTMPRLWESYVRIGLTDGMQKWSSRMSK